MSGHLSTAYSKKFDLVIDTVLPTRFAYASVGPATNLGIAAALEAYVHIIEVNKGKGLPKVAPRHIGDCLDGLDLDDLFRLESTFIAEAQRLSQYLQQRKEQVAQCGHPHKADTHNVLAGHPFRFRNLLNRHHTGRRRAYLEPHKRQKRMMEQRKRIAIGAATIASHIYDAVFRVKKKIKTQNNTLVWETNVAMWFAQLAGTLYDNATDIAQYTPYLDLLSTTTLENLVDDINRRIEHYELYLVERESQWIREEEAHALEELQDHGFTPGDFEE